MKRSSTFFFATLFISITLASCDYGKLKTKAEETATAFYTDLQKQDYKAALALCSSHAFTTDTKEAWDSSFKRNAGLLGELKGFTKTVEPVVVETSNLGTTVAIVYDVQWQYGKSKDSVVFVKEKDGTMKMSRHTWDYKDAKFLAEANESEKVAGQYMQAVKSGDYSTATGFCADVALKVTSKEQWAQFLQKATTVLGTVSDYKIVTDSTRYNIASTGDAGKGNYYDIVIQSQRGEKPVMEKMVFFQKTYNEPLKLTGHWFL